MNRALTRRSFGCAFGLVAALGLVGCAAPVNRPDIAAERLWIGRFSLVVNSDPPQSLSAGFELSGSADTGLLLLNSPLGSQIARVRWTAEGVEMQQGNRLTRHTSLESLATDRGEAPIPVAALFSWLAGRPAPVSGWTADLSRHAEGRIVARRLHPLPEAELRLIFEP